MNSCEGTVRGYLLKKICELVINKKEVEVLWIKEKQKN